MRIAIDVFGGDNAPGAAVEGCVKALEQFSDTTLLLFGDEAKIKSELKHYSFDSSRVEIINAPEIISCDEQPTLAIKRKKESSMVKALDAVRDGDAECIVSAGSTGALLTGATLIIRRIKGVKRPALAPLMPTKTGGCVMLIDCGANADCKPSYLQQFAVMADAYMRDVAGIPEPRIALLNNGAEEEKGCELTKSAHQLLKAAPVCFNGNVEARDVLSGCCDAVVCDGFTGNVALKSIEGMAETLFSMLKTELTSGAFTALGALLAKPAFRRIKRRMDYTEYGGAPLLGINGGVIKAHGSSNAKAFVSAIAQARKFIAAGVIGVIAEGIAKLPDIDD